MNDFYTRFYKELAGLDQVITGGETIRTFIRVLGLRDSALYNSLSVIPINIVEEMETMVKSYIEFENAKEGRKATQKETKKEVQEEKRPDQRPPKAGLDDHKCHPIIMRPKREVYETITPLTQEISVILAEMERKDLATPPAPRKRDAPMGNDLNKYCRYDRCKGHNTDDCKILKNDIENLIEKGFLKNFVVRREYRRNPR